MQLSYARLVSKPIKSIKYPIFRNDRTFVRNNADWIASWSSVVQEAEIQQTSRPQYVTNNLHV
jgi:hypothetical protein